MADVAQSGQVAGILYLITFASSIPAVFLLGPVLNNPNFIISAGGADQVRLGSLLDIVNCLTAIGTAVALYAVVKRQPGLRDRVCRQPGVRGRGPDGGDDEHPRDRHPAAARCDRHRGVTARQHAAHADRGP